MILITGGAYAGKTAYVKEYFGIPEAEMLDGGECGFEEITAKCIRNYHLLVRRLLAEGQEPLEFTKQLLRVNPEVIVILNEIGSGIIPIGQEERRWREYTGWCGCLLAEHAQAVVRICCGCASVIKGELQ